MIFQDITERKQASQIVLESKERLNRAENIGRLGNWEYDTINYHLIWSDQVYEMYERDPQLGPPTEAEESRYYSEADSQRLRGYAQNAINRGEPITDYEFQVNLPSGSSRIFSGSMFPIKDENSKVIKIFGVFQDITERKLAEQKINEQLDELRRWYSAMLGREERTMELKKEVNELLAQAGQPLRYTESL